MMDNSMQPAIFYQMMVDSGISFFAGVPDSLMKGFCHFINDNVSDSNHIIAANEGNALALGIGHHLSTGKVPLIYLQNSGLGNLVNPLLSLADPDVYSIPAVLLVGWRGEPGIKDEPQHKKQGRVTLELLDAMEIPYEILDSELTEEQVSGIVNDCVDQCSSGGLVRALVVRKGFFSNYRRDDSGDERPYGLSRERAIQAVIDVLDSASVIVSTTGLASRELFEYRDGSSNGHANDFLTVGGMGHANQIALGIALSRPTRNIICLDGDGALLMHMGAMGIIGAMRPHNFTHILLNNGAHDSVGGQDTVGFKIDFVGIARNVGYENVLMAENEAEIADCFSQVEGKKGPNFIEIRVNKGWRSDIGRPTETPLNNKISYMKQLRA